MKLKLGDHPAKILLAGYLAVILIGSILLGLPIATVSKSIAPIDALFTATSALCVTGLAVLPTGSTFTLFGQLVILTLIEIGGIGLMTFSTFFALLLFHRISFLEQKFFLDTIAGLKAKNFWPLVAAVFLSAFVIQAIGAVLFIPFFAEQLPFGDAVYSSIFHSVSAFCNAGFSIAADGLGGFRTHVGVNLIFMGLIVCGGLGFIVYVELYRKFRSFVTRSRFRLSIHSKLVLVTSFVLIVIGTASFFVLENSNVLKDYNVPNAILISLFHSISARTAGFSTVDFSSVTNGTAFAFIMLMFVGGAPGSAAGGVKVTTLAVFFLLIKSQLKKKSHTDIFGRTVAPSNILNTITLLVISVLIISAAVIMLQITESAGLSHRMMTRDSFLELFFETVSAFGTVGLSIGATPILSLGGKVVIILMMFVGRIGPLTLLLLMTFRREKERSAEFRFAEEEVAIG